MEHIRKKIKSREGAGEFISYAVSITLLLAIFMTIVLLSGTYFARLRMEAVSQEAARLIVVSDSLESAGLAASEYASAQLTGWKFVSGTVYAEVRYKNGSKKAWEKGAILEVEVSADVTAIPPMLPRTRYAITTVMLEYQPDD